jgi:hypothetical protein
MSLMTTTSELKQVGRDCLQAYTGLANPEHLCAAAELLFSVSDLLSAAEEENEGSEGGLRYLTSIESYLPFVCASIRTTGWLSRGAARQTDAVATADHALTCGVHWRPSMGEKCRIVPEEQDFNLANAVIGFCDEFFAGSDVMALSDYENSLRVAMASGIVHPKFVGIIASAVQFYQKDLERRVFAESKSKMFAESKFLGEEKARLVFENIQVVSYRTFESDFGVRHFYSFRTAEGSCLTTWTGRDLHLAIGQTLSVKGTVKKHETYQPRVKGAPAGTAYAQTVLSRVALVARAKVVSCEVEAKEETKVVEGPHYVKGEQKFNYWVADAVAVPAKTETKVVKYHSYHLVAEDGRKYVLISKSAKKALVAGYEAVVEYAVEDLSDLCHGERPVSLVA